LGDRPDRARQDALRLAGRYRCGDSRRPDRRFLFGNWGPAATWNNWTLSFIPALLGAIIFAFIVRFVMGSQRRSNLEMARERDRQRDYSVLLGALAGAAIGAGVGLVRAPAAGEENRKRLAEWRRRASKI